MPGRFVAASAVLIVSLHAVATPAAPPKEKLAEGAAACAAAKTALASRPHHDAFSVASANFDATYYHLNLNVDMVDDSIVGVVRVEGRIVNAALSQVTLDLSSAMHVTSVAAAGGGALAFTHPGAALHVTLPGSQPVGTLVAVDIRYRGYSDQRRVRQFLLRNQVQEHVESVQRHDAHRMEPVGAVRLA
jgi:hypothetical protein